MLRPNTAGPGAGAVGPLPRERGASCSGALAGPEPTAQSRHPSRRRGQNGVPNGYSPLFCRRAAAILGGPRLMNLGGYHVDRLHPAA